jgi:glycosyltransferase involved in cell wall biosynthesis
MVSTLAPPLPSLIPANHRSKPVICQLVHTLNVGGAEILARQFAERAHNEFDFVFACLDSAGLMADELRAADYPVEALARRPGFDWACVRRLAELCRRHHVQVIHAHQYAPFFYATLARFRAWRDMPIIFTEHGRDYPDYRRAKRVLANRWLLGRRDRVIGVGECVRRALIEYEGLPRDRVDVIYNGIDIAAHTSQGGERPAVRRSLGLADDHIAVIQVARLNHLKDHPTTIRALAQLVARFPQARLLVVGDGEERGKIQSLISELNLAQQVQLLGTRRDIPRLLAAADVFLLSSVSEGIPLTLIEAMAAGLPCVSTAVGGTPEVIVDGQTGLLARPGDPEDVAAKLAILLADVNLRVSMGAAGRERSRELFGDQQMHAAYQQLYRDMTGVKRTFAQRSAP